MKLSRSHAFTLIELLVVMAIIAILASLVLSVASLSQKKAARSRATTEIAALGAALENYKSDNGDYPSNSLTGSASLITNLMPVGGGKVYYEFKAKYTNDGGFIDPFGADYNYTYTMINGSMGAPNNGQNNYDLWSTAGGSSSQNSWIKNW